MQIPQKSLHFLKYRKIKSEPSRDPTNTRLLVRRPSEGGAGVGRRLESKSGKIFKWHGRRTNRKVEEFIKQMGEKKKRKNYAFQ